MRTQLNQIKLTNTPQLKQTTVHCHLAFKIIHLGSTQDSIKSSPSSVLTRCTNHLREQLTEVHNSTRMQQQVLSWCHALSKTGCSSTPMALLPPRRKWLRTWPPSWSGSQTKNTTSSTSKTTCSCPPGHGCYWCCPACGWSRLSSLLINSWGKLSFTFAEIILSIELKVSGHWRRRWKIRAMGLFNRSE